MSTNAQMARIVAGLAAYVAYDKSDPFCQARGEAHIRSGVAGIDPKGEDAFYDAKPSSEGRVTEDGTSYFVTVYHDIRRP